jgi:hypothetical protein
MKNVSIKLKKVINITDIIKGKMSLENCDQILPELVATVAVRAKQQLTIHVPNHL